MVPRPPEVIQRFGSSKWKILRRPHLVLADFGGDVDVAVLGQLIEPLHRVLRLDDRLRTCGRRGSCARASRRSSPTSLRAPACRLRRRGCATGAPCPPAHGAQSPTMPRSTLTFLLIEDGSMSMWIFFDFGEKASRRPVMRSSKRAPMQIIRSQSCMAMLASYVPCMPSMPSHCRSDAGIGAEPHQRRGDRKARQRAPARAAASEACGPELMTPPPV